MANLEAIKDRIDPTKYRVTMTCPCQADWVEGYGPTPEAAREAADRFWKQNHKGEKPVDIILEHAVEHGGGGSHYEEVA